MSSAAPVDVYVLWVGEASYVGAPNGAGWKAFVEWVGSRATNILVYFPRSSRVVPSLVSMLRVPAMRADFPDPDAPLEGLRLSVGAVEAKSVLRDLLCDPESATTHLFCYTENRLMAEMETNDGPNFVLFRLLPEEAVELSRVSSIPADNSKVCEEWKASIDDMVDRGDRWVPISRSESEPLAPEPMK